jgi:eukaryotic-like serine/threonine-protein kinase
VTDLVPRSRRDHYVFVRPLGRGGTAETWVARREGGLFPDEVCIKRSLRHLNRLERRALLEEARLLARIRHANVVQLLDALEDEAGEIFLALELVRGVDLRVLTRALGRRGRSLRPAVVATIGTCLCRALGAAQRAVPGGIVHRDVTPHNVLVSREGEVKLADFGIARAFDREQWTRAGLVKGKTGFLSPEQLRGDVLDVRSDLFAVGVILYELLLGQRPIFERAADIEVKIAEYCTSLALRMPAMPSGLIDVIASLLAAERSDRPPSADVAARLLSGFIDEQRAIDELRQNVADACAGEVIEVAGGSGQS